MEQEYSYLYQNDRLIVLTPKGFEVVIENCDDEAADEIIAMVDAVNAANEKGSSK